MNVFFVNGFLNLLQQFLDELKVLLPVWDDILAVQKTVELAEWSLASKLAVVDGFMYYIHPFYQQILLRKESFFLDTDNIKNTERFQEVDETTQNENYVKMFQLKGVWEQFSPHNKNAIWDFFCALVINGSNASPKAEYKRIAKWAEENKKAIMEAQQQSQSF